jgi:hypothetical protein
METTNSIRKKLSDLAGSWDMTEKEARKMKRYLKGVWRSWKTTKNTSRGWTD